MKNASILVVDDESNIRLLLDEILTEEGYQVTTASNAAEARDAKLAEEYDLILLDIWMPETDGISLLKEWAKKGPLAPVIMMSGHGTVDTAVEATRLGAVDYIEKPVSLVKLLRTIDKALLHTRAKKGQPGKLVPPSLAPVGKSKVMQTLRDQIAQIAKHDSNVLLVGEPGSGREMVARYLASFSSRAAEPFVTVMAEVLNNENGDLSFPGDAENPSTIDRAQDGILFINEIGKMSLSAQNSFSDLLKKKKNKLSNKSEEKFFNVRIISSADSNFENNSTGFMRELLSELSTVIIRIPPLRRYAEDVPELLRYNVEMLVDSKNFPFRHFSVAAQNRLRNYPWPGNIRELKNIVSRLLILSSSDEITLEEVEIELAGQIKETKNLIKSDFLSMPLREAREHFERAYLQQQLVLSGGKVGQLAKRVGMERTHLYRKLRSLGVDFRNTTKNNK